VGLEDLVVERLRCPLGGRHFGGATQTPHGDAGPIGGSRAAAVMNRAGKTATGVEFIRGGVLCFW
jgi:hypothetical protein